jgi:hypothetical protein
MSICQSDRLPGSSCRILSLLDEQLVLATVDEAAVGKAEELLLSRGMMLQPLFARLQDGVRFPSFTMVSTIHFC